MGMEKYLESTLPRNCMIAHEKIDKAHDPLDQPFVHKTVLLKEAVEALNIRPNGLIIDATFGGGGHTRAILESCPTVRVIALDWDTTAIKKNGPALKEEFGDRLTIEWCNFANLYRVLKKHKITYVDGILADFGTSQNQIHYKEGFSFAVDSPLDMRMSNAHSYVKASTMLAHADEKELATIFWRYGEERYSRQIARAIVENRTKRMITTTKALADLVASVVPYVPFRGGKKTIHPATRVFQALRIAVNHELDHIETFLRAAIPALAPEGRLALISFHSLEDRIAKSYILENQDKLITIAKKPIVASPDELYENPSSRSAKLRIAEKRFFCTI